MAFWSTDIVPQRERFDYWREIRSKNIFSTDVEIEREKQLAFHGTYDTRTFGGAILGEMHAKSYLVRRTRTDVARTPYDNFYIYQPLEGTSWFDRGAQGEFAVRAGSLALTYSDQPYANLNKSANGEEIHLRVLTIPAAVCRSFMIRMDDLLPRPLAAVPGIDALAVGYFNAIVAQAPHLTGPVAEAAVRTLAQLTFMARGIAPREEDGRDAIRAARLQAARSFVGKSLHRADLTPALAARALGISLRHLHALFEPTGTSFARYVLSRRLEAARLLLARDPGRPVTDIALACGIDSLPTFYRAFRSTYGTTPTSYRGSLTTGS